MRASILFVLLALIICIPANAAKPIPKGTFSLSPAPYVENGTISFTFGKITNVTNNYEVTLGVWCILPDGSRIPWGAPPHNPSIKEFNSFGNVFSYYTVNLYLPIYGTGYDCTAQLISALWKGGQPIEAWTLDTHTFDVVP